MLRTKVFRNLVSFGRRNFSTGGWWNTAPPYTKGPLSQEAYNSYFTNGFVVIQPPLLDLQLLEEVDQDIGQLVSTLAHKLKAAGQIKSTYEGIPHSQRLWLIEKERPHASVIFHRNGILPRAIQKIWENDTLVSIAQQVLGGASVSVCGNPIWNIRAKTPSSEENVIPWHQDNAYIFEEARHTHVPTTWIPLESATRENGCMQFVKKAHLRGKTAEHWSAVGNTWYVGLDQDQIEKTLGVTLNEDTIEVAEVQRGGLVLLNNLSPHMSTLNRSENIRWSLDLRYNELGQHSGCDKESILLRKAGESNFKPDWDAWSKVSRTAIQEGGEAEDDLTDTIHGPWMDQWPLRHTNRHTEARYGTK